MTSPAKIITVTQSQKVSIRLSMPACPDNPRRRPMLRLAPVALMVALAACSDAQPQGQVVATVDGTEITLAELNEEARSRGLDIAGDRSLRDALLRELVERKLLVREAEAREIDRSPQFLLAERRLREITLGQQLLATASRQQGTPSEPELRRFIAGNPLVFGGRELVRVEVTDLPATLPPALRQALAQAPDRAAMDRLLAGAGVSSAWQYQEWDSAAPPPGLSGWPSGRSFLLERGDGLVAGQVASRTVRPVPADEELPLARAMIERQRAEAAMTAILADARKSAQIRYQPGFGPER